MRV
ncbi:unnamed protein product [Linum tenue]|jgi:hypothetical protein